MHASAWPEKGTARIYDSGSLHLRRHFHFMCKCVHFPPRLRKIIQQIDGEIEA